MGVALVRVSQWDYSAACNRHHDELSDGTWKHRGEQAVTAAAASVAWRKSGQSRAWDASGDPITALASQTLAGWAFDHAPEPATPLPKFWMG
jgi:hypothetical protein